MDGAWTRPEIINISGQYRDAAPYLSPDGNTLLFDSRRPTPEDPSNAINLWQSRRTATGWSQPEFLAVPSQNTDEEPTVGQDEFGPAMDDSGQLYFYSFRQPYRGGARYVLPRLSDQDIRLDNSIPDPSDQTFISYLYVSPDATFAVMEGRARGRRDTDLFCSCKQEDGSWTEAVEVPGVNTAANEGGPFVTADGAYLLFTSNRRTKEASAGNANLYLVSAGKLREQCQGKD
ncbi:PD40 domain-containing protein [Lewinella sp. W8]|uniref:PD40 domain-containing protein n=1 Tax=Lewinella sp. W8 TaxID=2528208 RepID=UPI001067DC01|nr:PD40 domain-containing protein [Lewinella sp. W8]MTB51774.1 hypothetical protein [Lewinella sp. W8]